MELIGTSANDGPCKVNGHCLPAHRPQLRRTGWITARSIEATSTQKVRENVNDWNTKRLVYGPLYIELCFICWARLQLMCLLRQSIHMASWQSSFHRTLSKMSDWAWPIPCQVSRVFYRDEHHGDHVGIGPSNLKHPLSSIICATS